MAEIFVKKNGSDGTTGEYFGFDLKGLSIDFASEKCYLEVKKQFKNSNDEVITDKGYVRHELPEAAFNYILTAAELTKIQEYMEEKVNPAPEEPAP